MFLNPLCFRTVSFYFTTAISAVTALLVSVVSCLCSYLAGPVRFVS